MLDFFRDLLDTEALAPHGICLSWRPELLWTHLVSDALIGLAYFSIPIALGVFVNRRRDVAFGWVFVLFAIFIASCGATHFFAIWTLWHPDYGAEAVLKLLTAVASVGTAVALWPLLPQALALPSPAQLRLANEALAARIAERDAAIEALRRETAERESAEAQLRQAQKMQAIGQLTGGVAHDFNNLLTVIVANLDRLERHLDRGDPVVRRSLDHAQQGAERAAALTRQLLAFARKTPLDARAQDICEVLHDLGALLERSVGENVAVRLDCPRDVAPALVDRHQLENAIINLAVNARDAMPGGGTLGIAARNRDVGEGELGELPAGGYVEIGVSDTGTGMSEEVRERAFEPFYTTKELGKGTGLGLSQVYGFIKQSKGHVVIESAPGVGTAVRILLPRAA